MVDDVWMSVVAVGNVSYGMLVNVFYLVIFIMCLFIIFNCF